jgi:hypothetical protein
MSIPLVKDFPSETRLYQADADVKRREIDRREFRGGAPVPE